MKLKKNFIYHSKELLNTTGHHSTAAISCYIYDDRSDKYPQGFYGDLSISNCDRTLSLAIDLEEEEDIDNTLYLGCVILSSQ